MAETKLSEPATYMVFADGADTVGVGVGDPLVLGDGDAFGDDVAFDEAEDDGFGEAEDEAFGLATAPVALVSWRAPAAWPVPPDLLALGLGLDDAFDVDLGDEEALGDDFALDGEDGVGVGVGRGAGVVGVLAAAAGKPVPAGLSPGWHAALVGSAVVHNSTCLNRSDAELSNGLI